MESTARVGYRQMGWLLVVVMIVEELELLTLMVLVSIIPYINFMIERVGGLHPEDVGFYSGLIESLFSATQMLVMIFWGKVRHVTSIELGQNPQVVVNAVVGLLTVDLQ